MSNISLVLVSFGMAVSIFVMASDYRLKKECEDSNRSFVSGVCVETKTIKRITK